MTYTFTYRCRYCGKEFGDSVTGKALASKFLIQTACDLKKDAQHPGDKTIHYAEDHIGISDLIGCKIMPNKYQTKDESSIKECKNEKDTNAV